MHRPMHVAIPKNLLVRSVAAKWRRRTDEPKEILRDARASNRRKEEGTKHQASRRDADAFPLWRTSSAENQSEFDPEEVFRRKPAATRTLPSGRAPPCVASSGPARGMSGFSRTCRAWKAFTETKRRRSTGRQPWAQSASRLGDKPLINRLQTACQPLG